MGVDVFTKKGKVTLNRQNKLPWLKGSFVFCRLLFLTGALTDRIQRLGFIYLITPSVVVLRVFLAQFYWSAKSKSSGDAATSSGPSLHCSAHWLTCTLSLPVNYGDLCTVDTWLTFFFGGLFDDQDHPKYKTAAYWGQNPLIEF